MRSLKNYLIVFFVFTTFASGILAWRQHQELLTLRAATLNPAERAELQRRVAVYEQRVAELEKKTAEAAPSASAAADAAAGTAAAPGDRSEHRRGMVAAFDDPEVQRLMALQQKSALDGRYAALFRALKLSPEQLDRLKNLLVEKSTAVSDVIAAARSQGITRRSDADAFSKLIADAQAEIDENIRETLGEVGYQQYKSYEQTLPQRTVVNQLEQRLSYSSTPLTPEQSAQLVQILAAANPSPSSSVSVGPFVAGGPGNAVTLTTSGGGPRPTITDTAINQALGVLAAPQIEALRELQQEQQAQAELGAAMRRQFQNSRPAVSTGTKAGGG